MFAVSMLLLYFLLFGTLSAENMEERDNSEGFQINDDQMIGKRGIGHHRHLKIGIFRPLVCEGFYRHRKNIKTRDVSHGTGRSKLGFFTPVYCKHLENWLNNRKHGGGKCQRRNSDCYEILQCYKKLGKTARNGVYSIKPKHYKSIKVYCDMLTDGGGWTVFQHRMDGSENFYRTWSEYKTGFGKLNKEFWLGNDNLYAVVAQGHYALRLNLEDYSGNKRFAFYRNFKIGNENQKYKLTLGSYSGSAGNSLTYHNNQYFSTKDRDNDRNSKNCAVTESGAWWYNSCDYANLNSLYYKKKTSGEKYNRWYHWPGGATNMKKSQLAVRWLRNF